LPLLEAQYAGLPIIAPDAAIFREVLGESGIHIDTADPAVPPRGSRLPCRTMTGAPGTWRWRCGIWRAGTIWRAATAKRSSA
jgi:hypothetical protein